MSRSVAANRYALALFEVARQQGKLELIQDDMRELRKVFRGSADLRALLGSPKITGTKKKEMLKEMFAGADILTVNLLLVLTDAQRIGEAADVADEFIRMANESAGIAEAKVYSTRPLTEGEQQELSTVFASKIGKGSLQIENIVDPSLIGGVRIRIGNRIYDNSLKTKLDHLKRDLVNA
ncbi:F0F1 ATP synthase subunit delta [Bhargavaea ullalensis]|uniref:ATP synthase subunit delta n=1 Tax=Bhargavaea ullalensis TaxID=1265685 RepID=A0ABV2GBB6_9BACL